MIAAFVRIDRIDSGGGGNDGVDHDQDHDHDNEGWRRVQDRNRFPRNFAPGHHQLLATIAIIAQTLTVLIIIVQKLFHTIIFIQTMIVIIIKV